MLREERATPNGESTGSNFWDPLGMGYLGQGEAGETPLVCAAGCRYKQGDRTNYGNDSDPLGCMEALLEARADPNLPNSNDGATPLHAAAFRGCEDRVALLLRVWYPVQLWPRLCR